jgi:predicted nucleic acid binding AN1-type Zn finger protein
LLTNINKDNEKDKTECGQEYCSVNVNIDKCFSCGHPFCLMHFRQICHDCVNLYEEKDKNPRLKDKVVQKINDMEKQRNKKPKKK